MRFRDRAHVEAVGRNGSNYAKQDGLYVARVLDSFILYCDPDDLGFTPHMTTKQEGYWEAWITLWMDRNVKPGSRVIDIGANMGYYSMMLADMNCEVLAIEPQPNLAKLIRYSAADNAFDVQVDQVAIADEAGSMKMIVPKGHGMNASLAYSPVSPNGFDEIEVEVRTLNDYGEGFDFIKVDVEGAEDDLFKGAWDFIERNPDCVWLVEWRYDRMDHESAYAVAENIFEEFNVTYVDFNGDELKLTGAIQLWSQTEDWMLVLRRKK